MLGQNSLTLGVAWPATEEKKLLKTKSGVRIKAKVGNRRAGKWRGDAQASGRARQGVSQPRPIRRREREREGDRDPGEINNA